MVERADDLSIPKFLKRGSDGQPPAPPKRKKAVSTKPVVVEPSAEDRALAALEPDLRASIEGEMAAGRFLRHWLLDPSTVAMFRQSLAEKAVRREEGLARLRALKGAVEPRPKRPPFGQGVYIRIEAPSNPRKPGTAAHGRYDEMVAFLKKNPRADVAEVLEKTAYRKDDLAWDIERKAIKTDVGGKK